MSKTYDMLTSSFTEIIDAYKNNDGKNLSHNCKNYRHIPETLQAIDDVNNHRNLSRKFSSVEELMEDLNA